jgi:hypothetical protein
VDEKMVGIMKIVEKKMKTIAAMKNEFLLPGQMMTLPMRMMIASVD